MKAKTIGIRIAHAAMALWGATISFFSGNLRQASYNMIFFNNATKANPWGILAAVIATVVVSLIAFNRKLSESARLQKQLDERMQSLAS